MGEHFYLYIYTCSVERETNRGISCIAKKCNYTFGCCAKITPTRNVRFEKSRNFHPANIIPFTVSDSNIRILFTTEKMLIVPVLQKFTPMTVSICTIYLITIIFPQNSLNLNNILCTTSLTQSKILSTHVLTF